MRERTLGRIGRYELVRELGRGGMAVVYEAVDDRQGRRVALKVLHPGFLDDRRVLARFQREASISAELDHPGICPVFETGVEEGVAYIAMRFLSGRSLARQARESEFFLEDLGDMSRDERYEDLASRRADDGADTRDLRQSTSEEVIETVALIERAARALHVAHEAGLIHRDIKPGNIMVTDAGDPVLLDFGLARHLEENGTSLTRSGDLLGTPSYISPEQLQGRRHRVDRRSDVYSLGATLYELLTRHPPFEAPTREALYREILLSPPPDCRQLNRSIPPALKIVVETALAKEPRHRYATALDFARDLRRVCRGEPIRARGPGPLVRLEGWGRRHPALGTALVALFLALTAALVVTSLLLRRRERDLRKEQGLRYAAQSAGYLRSDPGLALLLAIEGARRQPGLVANNALLSALDSLSETRILRGHERALEHVEFAAGGSRLLTVSRDGTARIWSVPEGKCVVVIEEPEVRVDHATFDPAGRRVVVALRNGLARVVDASSGGVLASLVGHEARVRYACFSPDGTRVATASDDGTIRIWAAGDGRELRVLGGFEAPIDEVIHSLDGKFLASASRDGKVRLFDLSDLDRGTALRIVRHEGQVRCLAFSPGGRWLASGGADRVIRLLEIESGEQRELARHADTVRTLAFSPDGKLLLSASGDNTAVVRETATGEVRHVLRHYDAVRTAVWSSDGTRILTASKDRTARVWDAATGRETNRLGGHRGEVREACFSPDGQWVATASVDDTARLWRSTPGRLPVSREHTDSVNSAVFGPASRRFLTASRDGTLRIWEAPSGRQLRVIGPLSENPGYARFDPGGRWIVSVTKDGIGRVHRAASGEELVRIEGLDWERESAVFNATGDRLASVEGRRLRLRELPSGEPWSGAARLAHPDREVDLVRFAPDGQRLLAVDAETARGWVIDLETGRDAAALIGLAGRIFAARFGPRGRWIATTSDDSNRAVILWDAHSGRLHRVLTGHSGAVLDACFDPRGERLVTASRDGTARVWEIPAGRSLAVLEHESTVYSARFSSDGRWIVTASKDRTAGLWDAASGRKAAAYRHRDTVSWAEFSPDVNWVVTASRDGTARLWPVDPLPFALACRTRELLPQER